MANPLPSATISTPTLMAIEKPDAPCIEPTVFNNKNVKTASASTTVVNRDSGVVDLPPKAGQQKSSHKVATITQDNAKQGKSLIHKAPQPDPQESKSIPKELLQWLNAEEANEKPPLDIAKNTLETVLSGLEKDNAIICNRFTPEDQANWSNYQKMKDLRLEEEAVRYALTLNKQHQAQSENAMNELCKIPKRSGGATCDSMALLAFKELHDNWKSVTPILIGFQHSYMSNLVVGIFHQTSEPASKLLKFKGTVEQLGENIHIVDPWLGLCAPACEYPQLVEETIDNLNKKGHKFCHGKYKRIALSPLLNFTKTTSPLDLHHLPTYWKANKK